MKLNSYIICFLVLVTAQAWAQSSTKNGSAWVGHVSYGIDIPFGDLGDRFGNNFQVGLGVEKLFSSNLIVGLDIRYLFGNNVKEDPLMELRNLNLEILGVNNYPATVFLRERGGYVGTLVGKLFPFQKDKKSGLRASIGFGLFYHYIRLQDDTNAVPQIADDYAKGYDRLSRGAALKQQLYWQHMSQDRRLNFYIGLESMQAFTQNVRPINFDTQMNTDEGRLDITVGVRVGWMLPFYKSDDDGSEIFY